MQVELWVALSLGILVHAVAIIPFALWVFGGGAGKRWETVLTLVASVMGIFAYLIAMTDSATDSFIFFGLMRAFFELQRCVYLRVSPGYAYAVFLFILVANAIVTFLNGINTGTTIVSFIITTLLYLLALLGEYFFRHLFGRKAGLSLVAAFFYALGILIVLALSPSGFGVMSETVEFFIYPFLDIMIILVAIFETATYAIGDPRVSPFDFLAKKDGTEAMVRAYALNERPPQGEFEELNFDDNDDSDYEPEIDDDSVDPLLARLPFDTVHSKNSKK